MRQHMMEGSLDVIFCRVYGFSDCVEMVPFAIGELLDDSRTDLWTTLRYHGKIGGH